MNKKLLAATAVVLLSAALTGCGGGSTTVQAGEQQTKGQELLDLQKAHESGVISDKEYETEKKKILKKK